MMCLFTALMVHSGTPHKLAMLTSLIEPSTLLHQIVFFTTSKYKSDSQKSKLET